MGTRSQNVSVGFVFFSEPKTTVSISVFLIKKLVLVFFCVCVFLLGFSFSLIKIQFN